MEKSGEQDKQLNEKSLFASIRARPITPAKVIKISCAESSKTTTSKLEPAASFEICTGDSDEFEWDNSDHHGLKILGCTSPRRTDDTTQSTMPNIVGASGCASEATLEHSTTDFYDGLMEMTEDFQKLKLARNEFTANVPAPVFLPGNGKSTAVTIQSLSSNTVVVFPETHRNQSSTGGISGKSSGDNARVFPTSNQKSKLSRRRRKRRSKIGSGSERFSSSLLDEDEHLSCSYSRKSTAHLREHDDTYGNSGSDGGDSGRSYSAPQTAVSTVFRDEELVRPDTASSEILAEGALASAEALQLKMVLSLLNIQDEEDWYVGNRMEDRDNDSNKAKLRHLTKMFYRREETRSEQGPLYTYKLMLSSLHNRLEDFVLLSVPPAFNVKSRITRLKKGFVDRRFYPMYYMHLEREGTGDRKCLVLVAKKYKNLSGTGYIISTDPAELTTGSEYCVGRVESNFIGTEFILYGGRSICTHVPPEQGALMSVPKSERFKEELASIIYDPNVLGFKGPRKVKVVLPKMNNLLERTVVRPRIHEETLICQFKNQEDSIISLKNKDPIWSKETHSYILNFAGRVTTPSVKNFQIVSEENEEHIMLQFGRASENTFSLDFRYPFCPLQAFAIALSSFESKLACE